MKTLSRFLSKFTHLIVAVLSCFDRVLFKGHLALAAPCELEYFVDRVLKVRRSDFMKTMAPNYLYCMSYNFSLFFNRGMILRERWK